ncbi:hypothetical protein Tsubulata_041014 [Turnera subulata]|uniref:TLDc domain-containing protein n=1 Tax=Turnera subulata TaxID=218843 RepID=A0A9Q0G0I3_9ROSI|nr:hypothetical protein Tsubulata_041014 [Turnera subulata]
MGASSSTEQHVSSEQQEVETRAASLGSLPALRTCSSKLADPETNTIPLHSLQQCFSLEYKDIECEATKMPDSFPGLLTHLGSSIVDLLFVGEKGGVNWTEFVKGYLKCCDRMPASALLHLLLRVYASMVAKAGLGLKLEFESGDEVDSKIHGSLLPSDVLMLLWTCWTMQWSSRTPRFSKGTETLSVPDVSHLVLSAVVGCVGDGSGFDLWDCDVLSLEVELPVGKFLTWVLTTAPCLADSFTEFVNSRIQSASQEEEQSSSSSLGEIPPTKAGLLTRGRAWAISLTSRSTIREEILKPYFPGDTEAADENLLYWSSIHGKGLNRFWSNVEGYYGPLLILVSATYGDTHEDSANARKWIVGALTHQGFESKETFYGSSGNLYAIWPVFHQFSPSGKEKNFVYSHLHPTGRVYEPHPKPVGIAFGGTVGNERIFIDEDFAKITVRHHVVDKTYHHGSLFPNQGFLPVEASILEVEVWGLGGRITKQNQARYKKREELFTEQRRKVDLKTFASWEDSPEKMMMDMLGDPNRVQREDR